MSNQSEPQIQDQEISLDRKANAKIATARSSAFSSTVSFFTLYFFIQLYLCEKTLPEAFANFAPASLEITVGIFIFCMFITVYSLSTISKTKEIIKQTDKGIFLTFYLAYLGTILAPLFALLSLFSIFLNANSDIFIK